MRVKVLPAAYMQIAEIEAWWTEHRTKAPTLFIDELERALRQLVEHPYSGLRFESVRGGRRILLPRSGYHVYVTVEDDLIEVFGVEGGSTMRQPRR